MIDLDEFNRGFGVLLSAWSTYGQPTETLEHRRAVYADVLQPIMSDVVWRATVQRALVHGKEFPSIGDLLHYSESCARSIAVQEKRSVPSPTSVALARGYARDVTDVNYESVLEVRERRSLSWTQAADVVQLVKELPEGSSE